MTRITQQHTFAAALVWAALACSSANAGLPEAVDNLLPEPDFCPSMPTLALSQDFDPVAPGQVVRSADQFVVPDGETWDIRRVKVTGTFVGADAGNVTGVSLYIYSDNNGSPGGQICRHDDVAPTQGLDPGQPLEFGNFLLDAFDNTACPPLNAGSYWLSVVYRANTDGEPAPRQWYWNQTPTAFSNKPQWHIRDADDLDPDIGDTMGGVGCRNWQPADFCFSAETPLQSLCFGLGGDSPVRLVEPLLDQFASEESEFLMGTRNNFNDPDGDMLTFSAMGLPPSLTMNSITGRISGMVDLGAAAMSPYTVTVMVTDEDGFTAQDSFLMIIADDEVADYRFERLWPVLQQSWYFGDAAPPIGVYNDRLFVANDQFCQIQQFTLDGFLIGTYQIGSEAGPGCNNISGIGTPLDVVADKDGFIFAIGQGDDRVHKLDSSGNQVIQFEAPVPGQPNHLAYARRGCGDGLGCLYVAETSRVHRFTTAGEYLSTFGTGISNIGGLSIGTNGFIYITDKIANRVRVFEAPPGNLLGTPPIERANFGLVELTDPGDLDVDPFGTVYVVDEDGIDVFINDGALSWSFAQNFPPPQGNDGAPKNPVFIELAGAGSAFISNTFAQVARVFLFGDVGAADGTLVVTPPFASSGDEPGFFRDPADLVADAFNNVYVTDTINHRIQKFDPDGKFLVAWGEQGSEPGNFQTLVDVGAASVNGNRVILTLDHYDPGGGMLQSRIQQFSPGGVFELAWDVPAPIGLVQDMTVDLNGVIYAVDDAGLATKLGPDGTAVESWSPQGLGNFILIDLAPNGLLYLVKDNGVVEIFTRDAEFVQFFDTRLSDGTNVLLATPSSIAVADDGKVIIGEIPSPNPFGVKNGLKFFRQDGVLLDEIGEYGYFPGSFAAPSGLEIAPNGKLYVSDRDNDRIQVLNPVNPLENARAIIVAGGGPYPGNALWDATQALTNSVYLTLLFQGFQREDIIYLSPVNEVDLDGNGQFDDVDDVATNANIQAALQAVVDADNVVMYLADHGDSDAFRTSGLTDPSRGIVPETLSASTLDGWLNTLQGSGLPNLMLIYEACEAGSFIDDLSGAPANRVVIASAADGQNAQFVSQGTLSFSNQFWSAVFDGDDVKDAFLDASSFITATFQDQTPQLDADSDGVVNEPQDDIDALLNLVIGQGTENETGAPTIESVSLPFTVPTGNEGTIEAFEVDDPDGISRVYAIVRPPEYQPVESNNPILDFPVVVMEEKMLSPGDYEGIYSNFSIQGVYDIDVYAQDRFGNTSQPYSTTVTIGDPKNRRAMIVVGGNSAEQTWSAWSNNGGFAYQALINQGYQDDPLGVEDIKYLSDGGTLGVDLAASKSNLLNTLTTFAVDDVQDFTFYFIGPVLPGRIRLANGETLSAQEMSQAFDTLQGQIDGTLTIVVETDSSGSTLPALAPGMAFNNDRIVVTSTSPGETTALLSGGSVSFSQFFWNRVSNGDSVTDAFSNASSAIGYSAASQTPLLDDDGDGIGNDPDDGLIADQYAIGTGVVQAGNDPVIGDVQANPPVLSGGMTSASFTVSNVTSTGTVLAVRGVVTSPLPQSIVTEFALTETMAKGGGSGTWAGTCTGCFSPFSGNYEVAFYAFDDQGHVSFQQSTTVLQTVGPDGYEVDDTPPEGTPTWVDAIDAQPHTLGTGDQDFMFFWADEGQIYQIDASNVSGSAAIEMTLFCDDDDPMDNFCTAAQYGAPVMGNFRLVKMEAGLAGEDFFMTWPAPGDPVNPLAADDEGPYHVMVRAQGGSNQGTYNFTIFRPQAPDVGLLLGNITNALTSAPLYAALVESSGNSSAYSDQVGDFQLAENPGSYTADVNLAGYLPTQIMYELEESQVTYVSVALTPVSGPPDVSTTTANNITQTSAQLRGLVTPNGESTNVSFEYGTALPGTTVTADQDPIGGTDPQTQVTATVVGLLCGTQYTFRADADNINGAVQGAPAMMFTTLDCTMPPTIDGTGTSAVGETSVTLEATVTAAGSTQVDFGYRPVGGVYSAWDNAYDDLDPAAQLVQYPVAGLSCNTAYEFRVRATNAGGTTQMDDLAFVTAACPVPPPSVTTLNAINIDETSATIQADIDPQGESSPVEYRFRTSGGMPGTWTGSSVGSIALEQVVQDGLTGLTCETQYLAQYRASNSGGTTEGAEVAFLTAACPPDPPEATTDAADQIEQLSARVNGTIDAKGNDTTVTFDYGLTTAYGTSVTLPDPVTGAGATPVNLALSGLSCGREYHFRVQGSSVGGTTLGQDQVFSTNPCDSVLLVDDDDNTPDVVDDFRDALNGLGFQHQLWNTQVSDEEPSGEDLAPYDVVIWFTGDNAGTFTGPGDASEVELQGWLEAGGCLVVLSQDYLAVKGGGNPTALMSSHLGLASGIESSQTQVSGASTDFALLGPYNLDFVTPGLTAATDALTPAADAEAAMSGDGGTAAIQRKDFGHNTAYLGFPFSAIPGAVDQGVVMSAILDFCRDVTVYSDGFEDF